MENIKKQIIESWVKSGLDLSDVKHQIKLAGIEKKALFNEAYTFTAEKLPWVFFTGPLVAGAATYLATHPNSIKETINKERRKRLNKFLATGN